MNPKGKLTVSVVVPVLNAAPFLPGLFEALFAQDEPPLEVLLVDSGSTDKTKKNAEQYQHVTFIQIDKFTHGRARNVGANCSKGDIVVFLTQDAVPQDSQWLTRLREPFRMPDVAASYSRQIPKDDASPMERYFLTYRFPQEGVIRRKDHPDEELTFEKAFFSNVSGAVRRDLLMKFPFDENLIMSEDQQLSRDLINAGYSIAYVPESIVLHSHNYSLGDVVKRYFDSVYSLRKIYPAHGLMTSSGIGINYLKGEVLAILKENPSCLPNYFLYSFAKMVGTIAAHFADNLPRSILRRISLHKYYWDP